MLQKLSILIFISLLFVQCERKMDYAKVTPIKNGSWNINDTISFSFDAKANSTKDINLVLRHDNTYSYSNLYLIASIYDTKNTLITRDTIQYTLAKPNGVWLGSGTNSLREIYFSLREKYKFPTDGKYKISIVQAMRQDNLQGIIDLGINIK